MPKKVTMQMIADELNISKSLVSKALANKPGVKDETRDKIREVAAQMGYTTNSSVMTVSTSETGNIAVLLPREDIKDLGYWGKVIHGIEKELDTKEFSMILSGMNLQLPTSEALPSCITDHRVEGVFILGRIPPSYVLAVHSMGIPLVLVDPMYKVKGPKLDYVMAENYEGGYEAAYYLLDNGHRSIGFVGDITYSLSFKDRYRGFVDAVKDYADNKDIDVKMTTLINKRDSEVPYCSQQVDKIFEEGRIPEGLVCGNDPVAFEVLEIMKKNNIFCPENISVIGFDNVNKSEWMNPSLTSVDACKVTIGKRAVHLMLRRLKNPDIRPEHIMITTQIIKRSSVKINN